MTRCRLSVMRRDKPATGMVSPMLRERRAERQVHAGLRDGWPSLPGLAAHVSGSSQLVAIAMP